MVDQQDSKQEEGEEIERAKSKSMLQNTINQAATKKMILLWVLPKKTIPWSPHRHPREQVPMPSIWEMEINSGRMKVPSWRSPTLEIQSSWITKWQHTEKDSIIIQPWIPAESRVNNIQIQRIGFHSTVFCNQWIPRRRNAIIQKRRNLRMAFKTEKIITSVSKKKWIQARSPRARARCPSEKQTQRNGKGTNRGWTMNC